jgi:drug/metabolite transporter (DMT)-like permease
MQQATAIPAGAHPRSTAYALLAVLMLVWGANWPVMKITIAILPPLWFVVMRLLLGAITLFAALAFIGGIRIPSRRDLVQLMTGAVLQLALYMGLIILGLRDVGAGRSSVLAYTTPLWVVPGAILFLGEKFTRLKAAGFIAGLAGVLVLFNPFAFVWSDPEVVIDNGLLMLAAFSWAAAILIVRGRAWHLTPLQLAPWQLLLGGLLLMPFAGVAESLAMPALSWKLTALMVYNGPITIGFGYWASVSIARSLPAVTSSLSFLAVPVMGIISSAWALGERIDISLLAGFGLILAGLVLVAAADRKA